MGHVQGRGVVSLSKYVISIDPGIADLGVAVFKNKKLIHASHVVHGAHRVSPDKTANMTKMALALQAELERIEQIIQEAKHVQVVVELARAGSFMATFLKMAFVAGGVVGFFGDRAEYLFPQANQWKIGRAKEPSHEHYMEGLNKREIEVLDRATQGLKKPERYDVYDAVCIGRWYLTKEGS
jgi:hypothetical protein